MKRKGDQLKDKVESEKREGQGVTVFPFAFSFPLFHPFWTLDSYSATKNGLSRFLRDRDRSKTRD